MSEYTTNFWEEGLATVPEAARFMAISRSGVYVLMTRGVLPYSKIGKSRRIPWAALRQLAKESLVNACD
jgi:excisionase family DNA binding protein